MDWTVVPWDWLLLTPVGLVLLWFLGQAFGAKVVLTAERGIPAKITAVSVARWVREGVARSFFWLLTPLGAPRGGVRGGDTPVLLVVDYRTSRASARFLRTFLRRRGHGTVWVAGHRSADATLAELAEDLGGTVAELCEATGAERVDIVAHGMGGLVAAWYVRHLEGAPRVRRLVTLGTPWRGTRLAIFGRGSTILELYPGAPMLDGLTPLPVSTVCIWSPSDPFVVPSSSAITPDAESVRLDGSGHAELLLSAHAFRAVQAALSHPHVAGAA